MYNMRILKKTNDITIIYFIFPFGNHVVSQKNSFMLRNHEGNRGKNSEKFKNEINLSEGGRYVYSILGFIN